MRSSRSMSLAIMPRTSGGLRLPAATPRSAPPAIGAAPKASSAIPGMSPPLSGRLAGDLEDHAAPDLDGVIGKPFVVPAKQRHVDGSGHAVLPLAVHQHREEVAVQVVHVVVIVVELSRPIRISGLHNIFDAVADVDGDAAHFGEVAVDLFGECLRRV